MKSLRIFTVTCLSIVLFICLATITPVKAASTIDSFVTRMYEYTLDREPDPSGFQYWTTMLAAKKATAAQALQGFVFSNEFSNKNLSEEQYVTILYRLVLDRMPDQGGLDYWTNLMRQGHSRLSVLSNFVSAPEFVDLANRTGIEPGKITATAPMDLRVDLSGFVTKFYRVALNRVPDEGSVNNYVSLLSSKKIAASKVAEDILLSQEMNNRNITDEEFLSDVYQCLFGREIDQGNHDTWLKALTDGYSRRYVVSQLVQTNEFKTISSKYNVISGSISYEAIDSRPDLKNFVTRFYVYGLGRQPDYEGLKYYVAGLAAKNYTAAQLSDIIFYSPEFIGYNLNSNDYIGRLYRCFFDREPDEGGLNSWLTALLDGYSRRYVLANFINSAEFQALASKFNVNSGQAIITAFDTPFNGTINAVATEDVNLRTQSSLSSQVIMLIPKGSRMVIVNRAPSFYYVRYLTSDNKLLEGYVWDDYIQPYTDDNKNDMLGVLSEKYESNGDPGAISSGTGDWGGKSYGVWQFASNPQIGSLQSFLNWLSSANLGFYNTLNSARIQDGNIFGTNFDNTWKSIAANNYDAFYQLQHQYIKQNYYDSLLRRLTAAGAYDRLLSSFSVRNVLWSTAVQHGISGAYNIIMKFVNITDNVQFINAVYDERSKLDVYFPSSSGVWPGLTNRFINERADALNIYNNEVSYRK